MKSNLLTNVLLLVLIALVIIFNLIPQNSNRYSMIRLDTTSLVKMNNHTGQTWLVILADKQSLRLEFEIGGYTADILPDTTTSVWKKAVKR